MNEYLTYRRACLLGCERTPCGGLSVGHQRTNEAQYTSINYGRKDQTEWVDGIKRTDGKMEKRVDIYRDSQVYYRQANGQTEG